MIRINPPCFSPAQIADSGQCFRMTERNGVWQVIRRDRLLILAPCEDGFRLNCSAEDFETVWKPYFDLDEDYERFRSAVAGDPFLERAAEFGKGIRILRQDPWETLCTFIISQNNNIPKIKKSVEALCRLFGEEKRENGEVFFAFPTPERLADATERERALLRSACALGYRDKFVLNAAESIRNGETDLEELQNADDEALFSRLTALNGVGKKVASCVMLFGFRRIGAFPIDTWMRKILNDEYAGAFDPTKYDGFQGVIQQYMFYYRRNGMK